ncbi:hypothetical protein FRC07_008197 [Ceratobasidium sp. 392]|nr:hypothetical protein FRC07_008197 [Ceratobasidium sp. 392]
MGRRSPFGSISLQRRRAPPAALDLSHSTFTKTVTTTERLSPTQVVDILVSEPLECVAIFEEEQARASAELERTQAVFTASLEHEPLPGVRVRSPTTYRVARIVVPMAVEEAEGMGPEFKTFLNQFDETEAPLSERSFRFPLPDGTYQFPPTSTSAPRPSIGSIEMRKKKSTCIPIPWSTLIQILRLKCRRRKRHGRVLPEPLGFHERIKNSSHEWRPTHSQLIYENKGGPTVLNVVPPLYAQ